MPGIDSAGDVAEKVVPLVQFPVLMRMLLPGVLATTAIYPFLALPTSIFRVQDLKELEQNGVALLALAALVFVAGALIAALNGEIYKLYEGRSYWPGRLLVWGIGRQQARVDKLKAAADAESPLDSQMASKKRESRDILRTYPTKNGEYYASHPTRLGNILAGYEEYPFSRYGMSSVFYFTRIWMEMEKEKKEEIDSAWSIADGFLNLSATANAAGVLWIVAAALGALDLIDRVPLGDSALAALGGVGWLVLGYVVYRVSLPFHRQNGERFKSIFDLYRKKVWKITKLQPGEIDAWHRAWRYFQFFKLNCPRCDESGQLPGEPCTKCGSTIPSFR
jgi:hypothetical protein